MNNAITLPVYEAKITGIDNTGIFAMSFVDIPANARQFVALKKNQPVKLALDKHKQTLTGVVLVPGQMIYRNDDSLGEYYLRFTKADIEKIADKMMRTGVALSTTTHQHGVKLRGNYLTEIWIVSDPKRDKSVALGMGEQPVGTLCASYKVVDRAYWRNEVLTGNVRGFSIEAFFNFNTVNMKKPVKTAAQAAKGVQLSKFGQVLQALGVPVTMEDDSAAAAKAVADEAKKDETDSGEPFLIFDLQDGGEVYVDADGFATLDGEQMPAGEHALADGNFIVIDDSGMLVVTQPEADGAEPSEAAVAMAKERAKTLLAKMKTPASANAAQIAELKAKIAELEKQPSTSKAKAPVEGGGAKDAKDMTYTEKMAAVIASRRERKDGK